MKSKYIHNNEQDFTKQMCRASSWILEI